MNRKPAARPRIQPIPRSRKLAQKISEYLARLIAEGAFKPGERLPSENELAQRLKVSRPTVREALRSLEAGKLLEIRPRSGAYVRSAIPSDEMGAMGRLIAVDPGKIWELLQLRRILDAEAAALAATRRTEADLRILRSLAGEATAIPPETFLRRTRGGKTYVKFFNSLVQATHNTLFEHLRRVIDSLVEGALPASRHRLAGTPGAAEAIQEHIAAIFRAVEAGEPDWARTLVRDHVDYLEEKLKAAFGETFDSLDRLGGRG